MSKKSDIETMRALVAKWDKAQAAKKGPKAKKAAKKVWTDRKGRTFKEAQTAHYSARKARWMAEPLGGLTSDQRHEIAATLDYGYSRTQWVKAVKKFKAGGFR